MQTSVYAPTPMRRHRRTWFEDADKLAHRGRGLDELEKRVGPICELIGTRLIGAKRKVRLLEIGCGYGVVLAQLRRRFGDQVDLVGTNKVRSHGDRDTMVSAALVRGVFTPEEIRSVRLPTIANCDVSDGLPFDAYSFDLVVSQMCIQYLPDKILFLREAARVLKAGGIAMIHTPLDCASIPTPYSPLLEIRKCGAPLGLRDYLAKRTGQTCLQLGYHSSVHLTQCDNLGEDLELIHVIELISINSSWDGSKSIYRLR